MTYLLNPYVIELFLVFCGLVLVVLTVAIALFPFFYAMVRILEATSNDLNVKIREELEFEDTKN